MLRFRISAGLQHPGEKRDHFHTTKKLGTPNSLREAALMTFTLFTLLGPFFVFFRKNEEPNSEDKNEEHTQNISVWNDEGDKSPS